MIEPRAPNQPWQLTGRERRKVEVIEVKGQKNLRSHTSECGMCTPAE